ncbi:cytidine deaminase [Pustulibacterium marinum]|uniref:Cytidine deaminase n=1 Tax=Pustulibacterium marinum TaxID=1224947 RepID=A0A1I7F4N1_9FLAO|nr:cytidine deaminase [Pustulibacterium marinum]SFU31133.1 cytidine deaminase [Pustulibacterium marinum]
MKELQLTSTLYVYDDLNELSEEVQQLMLTAIETRKKAYAPYSKFRVGAALLLDNDEVVVGSNQENAAYPSGLCAERVAIFYAGAKFPDAIVKRIAISATSDTKVTIEPIPPCGACRQSIAEYEVKQGAPIEIYFMGETGKVIKSNSLKDLLPLIFDGSAL